MRLWDSVDLGRRWRTAPFTATVACTPSPPPGRVPDTALFPKLALGWINADFRVQIRIFQHFSKSSRKSSSRKQSLQIFAKKKCMLKPCFTFLGKFCNFFNFKFSEIRKMFAKCCRIFCRILQKCVDFEKC